MSESDMRDRRPCGLPGIACAHPNLRDKHLNDDPKSRIYLTFRCRLPRRNTLDFA
jgi:hypothetical protein